MLIQTPWSPFTNHVWPCTPPLSNGAPKHSKLHSKMDASRPDFLQILTSCLEGRRKVAVEVWQLQPYLFRACGLKLMLHWRAFWGLCRRKQSCS